MNTGDQVLLNAHVFDVPDMDEDEPRDRFYVFKIEPTASGYGTELVAVREEDVPKVIASGFGWPAENLPVGSIVAAPAWVAIKDDDLDHPKHPWEITGGSGHVSNATINKAIADGEARIFRVGDGTEPAEGGPAVEPELGILATLIGLDGSRLTDESEIEIDGTIYPIPREASNGMRIAPARLCQAIRDAGYRPMGGDYRDALTADWGGIRVEPISE